MVVRRRAIRLPAGPSMLNKLRRVEAVLKDLEAKRDVSQARVAGELEAYRLLLRALWLWGVNLK